MGEKISEVEKTEAPRGHSANKWCFPELNTVALAPKTAFFSLSYCSKGWNFREELCSGDKKQNKTKIQLIG